MGLISGGGIYTLLLLLGRFFLQDLTSSPTKLQVLLDDGDLSPATRRIEDALGGDPSRWSKSHGLLLLLPDALAQRRTEQTFDILDAHGFSVVSAAPVRFNSAMIEALIRFEAWRATIEGIYLTWRHIAVTPSIALLVEERGRSAMPIAERLKALRGRRRPELAVPGTCAMSSG